MRNPLGVALLLLSLLGCGVPGEIGDSTGVPDSGLPLGSGSSGNSGGQTGGASSGVGQSTGVTPGGTSGAGVPGGTGGAIGNQSNCTTAVIPADVATVLANRCWACHGSPPIAGVPASLATYAGLMARSKTDPTRTNAQLAMARVQDNTTPMPPAPASRLTAAEVAVLGNWVAAGSPAVPCADAGTDASGNSSDGGTSAGTGVVSDPYNTPPVCTSMITSNSGNHGGAQMYPGLACINCHSRGEGPGFAIAGTLFPTAHEPDLCNGASGANGAKVVIIGADNQMVTLTPNAAGNFSYRGNTITTPYQAKIVYMGRERVMAAAQTNGDCNSCHTQSGLMKAPGRIMLP